MCDFLGRWVSSCKEAKSGAEIASKAITNLLLKKGAYFLAFEREQSAELAISHILYELRQKAEEDHERITEYSSTIASVLFDKEHDKLLCFNLGDSIIVGAGKGRCRILAMPADSSSGCCVTTTKNAVSMTSVNVIDTSCVESVVICSDGAWRRMFSKNKLKPEVAGLLADSDFKGLKEFLIKQDCFDDHSFVSMVLQRKQRRRAA